MTEEGKSQRYVETHKAIAAGIASVIAAVFTSRLGVAGTLIGTAVTAVLITLGSAIFKAQLMKASQRIAGLPQTVRGRLSIQQVRIPGKPNAEPNPEPAANPEVTDKRPGLLSRLRAVPGFLKELPSAQRRRVLLAGLLAGLMATVIGLGAVTGIELVGGKTLSCLVWSCPDDSDSEELSSSSGLSIFGGRSYGSFTDTQSVPSGDQPVAPGNQQQVPGQPNGQPAQPGTGQPNGPPQDADPSQPGTGPGTGVEEEPTPPENSGSEKGRGLVPEEGKEKEDRY